MRKRLISIVLTLIMVMTMTSGVFAAGKTSKNAEQIALKNAKLAKKQISRLSVKFDRKDGEYDVKFVNKKNGARYSYEIRKANGRITEKSINYKHKRNTSRKKISKLAAQKVAARATGVKLAVVQKGKCKYEYDDGEGVYEVEFRNGNYKYDVEIQAPTGKVKEHSWEYRGR